MTAFKNFLYAATVVTLGCKLLVFAALASYPALAGPDTSNLSTADLVAMTNSYRTKLGLEPLVENIRLKQAAANHARDLLTRQYFDHTAPDGRRFSSWVRDMNYQYLVVGENLGMDFSDNQKLFSAWLDSPTHRANIVRSDYREIGIAAVEGKFQGRPTVMVVQMFGGRVLGATELHSNQDTVNNQSSAGTLPAQTGYSPSALWSWLSLSRLDTANQALNYALVVFITTLVISYRPQRKTSQLISPIPTINRYQMNIPKP